MQTSYAVDAVATSGGPAYLSGAGDHSFSQIAMPDEAPSTLLPDGAFSLRQRLGDNSWAACDILDVAIWPTWIAPGGTRTYLSSVGDHSSSQIATPVEAPSTLLPDGAFSLSSVSDRDGDSPVASAKMARFRPMLALASAALLQGSYAADAVATDGGPAYLSGAGDHSSSQIAMPDEAPSILLPDGAFSLPAVQSAARTTRSPHQSTRPVSRKMAHVFWPMLAPLSVTLLQGSYAVDAVATSGGPAYLSGAGDHSSSQIAMPDEAPSILLPDGAFSLPASDDVSNRPS